MTNAEAEFYYIVLQFSQSTELAVYDYISSSCDLSVKKDNSLKKKKKDKENKKMGKRRRKRKRR